MSITTDFLMAEFGRRMAIALDHQFCTQDTEHTVLESNICTNQKGTKFLMEASYLEDQGPNLIANTISLPLAINTPGTVIGVREEHT